MRGVVGVAETVLVRSQIIEVRPPDTSRLGSSKIVRTGGVGCLALTASFTKRSDCRELVTSLSIKILKVFSEK